MALPRPTRATLGMKRHVQTHTQGKQTCKGACRAWLCILTSIRQSVEGVSACILFSGETLTPQSSFLFAPEGAGGSVQRVGASTRQSKPTSLMQPSAHLATCIASWACFLTIFCFCVHLTACDVINKSHYGKHMKS